MEEARERYNAKLLDVLKSGDATSERTVRLYEEEAENYERILVSEGSVSPDFVAAKLAERVAEAEERSRMEILDVAAGTGRLGERLVPLGFKNLDALEPGRNMLDLLEKKGIYQKTYCQFLGGSHKLEAPDCCYDAVVVSSAFVKGHLPVDTLLEIVRLIRPGGYFVTAKTREKFGEEYDEELEAEMGRMEAEDKVWQRLERHEYESTRGQGGVCYVYQKT